MKNQQLKLVPNSKKEEFNPDDFTELHSMVEGLLSSIGKQKQVKPKKPRSHKKWKTKAKKKRSQEDLGIRELPFTF